MCVFWFVCYARCHYYLKFPCFFVCFDLSSILPYYYQHHHHHPHHHHRLQTSKRQEDRPRPIRKTLWSTASSTREEKEIFTREADTKPEEISTLPEQVTAAAAAAAAAAAPAPAPAPAAATCHC